MNRILPSTFDSPLRGLRVATLAAGALLLAGCSGLGAGSSLTCKLPDGARCDSVSSTYTESVQGQLPGQRKRAGSFEEGSSSAAPMGTAQRGEAAGGLMYADPRMTQVGMPLRSAPRIVRVWIKPWEDSDGDLHDQTFVYVPVDEGRWLVEHKQREVRAVYSPSRASARATGVSPAAPGAPVPPRPAVSKAAATAGNGQPTAQMSEAFQRAKASQDAAATPAPKTTAGARNGG